MSEKLKPCPFCGGEAETGFEDWHAGGHVKCTKCGAIGPVWSNDTHEAVDAWNERSANRESFDAGWEYHKLLDTSQARLSEAVKVLEPFRLDAEARKIMTLGEDIDHWPIGGSSLNLGHLRAVVSFLDTLGEEK